MGSPSDSLPADIVMAKLKSGPLDSSTQTICLCKRYRDAVFHVLNPLTRTNRILNKFNSDHESVKLTAEVDLNSETKFLDVPSSRREGRLLLQ